MCRCVREFVYLCVCVCACVGVKLEIDITIKLFYNGTTNYLFTGFAQKLFLILAKLYH